MKTKTQSLLVLLLISLLCGCYRLSYEDISSTKEGQSVIGDEYVVSGKVTLYGYRENTRSPPVSASLKAAIEIDGPEVAFGRKIKPGSRVVVVGLQRTNDIPFMTCRRELLVKMLDYEVPYGVPVKISVSGKNKGENCISLNENFYTRVVNE